jgi:hypothetical protein
MAATLISFGRDIRPLFRDDDVEAMRFALDLDRLDSVRDHVDAIVSIVTNGDMPCDGPWPEEQVALLRRWRAAGCPA